MLNQNILNSFLIYIFKIDFAFLLVHLTWIVKIFHKKDLTCLYQSIPYAGIGLRFNARHMPVHLSLLDRQYLRLTLNLTTLIHWRLQDFDNNDEGYRVLFFFPQNNIRGIIKAKKKRNFSSYINYTPV